MLEVIDPKERTRTVEVVFLGSVLGPATGRSLTGEPGAAPEWVPRQRLPEFDLKPPIGGHPPAMMHPNPSTAPYLGNLWRPEPTGTPDGTVAAAGQGPAVTILLPLPVIQTCQVLTIAVAAPGISGVIATAEARLQGRRGPRLLQPYFDLWKSFGRSRWRRRAPARSSCWRRWCRSRVS